MADTTPPLAPANFEPPEHKTLSLWFALLGLMLVMVSIWAVWDETYTRRPWKMAQQQFIKMARAEYSHALARQEQALQTRKQTKEYQAAEKAFADAKVAFDSEIQNSAQVGEVKAKLEQFHVPVPNTRDQRGKERPPFVWFDQVVTAIQRHTDVRRKEFQAIRGRYQAALWQWETYHSAGSDAFIRANEADVDARTQELAQLDAYRELMSKQRSAFRANLDKAQSALAALSADRDLAQTRLDALSKESLGIRQAFVPALDVVDRCESCHAGIQKAGLEALPQPYASHPGHWLKTHPVEKFGCTPCHRGDGFATETVWQAHGQDPFWLKPMLKGRLQEAACYKCHASQLTIPGAPTLSKGKMLFKDLGCWGCHKMRGFGREEQELVDLTAEMARLRKDLDVTRSTYKKFCDSGDQQGKFDLAPKLNAMETNFRSKQARQKDLLLQIRHIAPDLIDVRSKLKPGWMEYWLEEPKRFRPFTRMPAFWPRLAQNDPLRADDKDYDERGKLERHAIIAYLWQTSTSTLDAGAEPAASQADRDAGKTLVESRGCRGCHNITPKDASVVPEPRFGPALDRIGEKTSARWIERWVKNPRAVQPGAKMPNLRLTDQEAHQVAAYLVSLTKPSTPGEPGFSTPAFLTDTKAAERDAARLAQLDGTAIVGGARTLPEMGQKVINRYGCFGCHQIKGFEKTSKIGTELSSHGSKFLELLDHALLEDQLKLKGGGQAWQDYVDGMFDNPQIPTTVAPKELAHERQMLRDEFLPGPQGQLDGLSHQGWFATKLMNPRVFDRYKRKKAEERLKMPNFRLTPDEIYALVTFIMGNTDEIDALPEAARYKPSAAGAAIVKGETIIHKLNCTGCHRFEEVPTTDQQALIDAKIALLDAKARRSAEAAHVDLAKNPKAGQASNADKDDARSHVLEGEIWQFAPSDDKTLTPPPLFFEGAKAQSRWIFDFLKAPFQMRPRHEVRMPTFDMSDEEATALVDYFGARAKNAYPFEAPSPKPDPAVLADGKTMFDKSQCLKCHVPGLPGMDEEDVKAPDLRLAPVKLRASWIGPWTLDPQRFQSDVIMPSFQDTWGKDADRTATAIAAYLMNQDKMAAAGTAGGGGATPVPAPTPTPTGSPAPGPTGGPSPAH